MELSFSIPCITDTCADDCTKDERKRRETSKKNLLKPEQDNTSHFFCSEGRKMLRAFLKLDNAQFCHRVQRAKVSQSGTASGNNATLQGFRSKFIRDLQIEESRDACFICRVCDVVF